jgi:hypothetical protein
MATKTEAPSKKGLLKQLESCKDKQKAAYLRLKLRKLGHKGGLRAVGK